MLAKMGWNKGSGLGKEQHGSIDFIQVRYKNNAGGLGYDVSCLHSACLQNFYLFSNILGAERQPVD